MRFEVFKRDRFTCQYCGAKAPDVLLHVDHVEPKSKGGTDDMTNLVAACASCNGGKSARRLSDDSAVTKQRNQLVELEERRQQLEMMLEWQRSLVDMADQEVSRLEDFWHDLTLWRWSDVGRERVRKVVRKFGTAEVADAMRIAAEQYVERDADGRGTSESTEIAMDKIGGICAVRRAQQEKPYLQELLYIRGIVRNRCAAYWSNFKSRDALEWLEAAYSWENDITTLTDIARRAGTWSQWTRAMGDYIEECEKARKDNGTQ